MKTLQQSLNEMNIKYNEAVNKNHSKKAGKLSKRKQQAKEAKNIKQDLIQSKIPLLEEEEEEKKQYQDELEVKSHNQIEEGNQFQHEEIEYH